MRPICWAGGIADDVENISGAPALTLFDRLPRRTQSPSNDLTAGRSSRQVPEITKAHDDRGLTWVPSFHPCTPNPHHAPPRAVNQTSLPALSLSTSLPGKVSPSSRAHVPGTMPALFLAVQPPPPDATRTPHTARQCHAARPPHSLHYQFYPRLGVSAQRSRAPARCTGTRLP